VLSKLYRESELRQSPGRATINPRTAASLGFGHARTARLLTAAGSLHVTLSLDEGVMPGVVEFAVAPDPVALGRKPRPGDRAALDLFTPAEDGSWSSVDAELMEG
jgi:anaerobic selenocysteine-containing dehydrogenase